MDGYTCQLIIDELNLSNYHFFNANYGLEVKTQLETIITDIDQNEHDANILITDLNLLVEEGKYLERQRERLAKKRYINYTPTT
jgi:oligoribonuclease NrnB/cAMP/cGMP phosphodiesterase (DHH superfamily)